MNCCGGMLNGLMMVKRNDVESVWYPPYDGDCQDRDVNAPKILWFVSSMIVMVGPSLSQCEWYVAESNPYCDEMWMWKKWMNILKIEMRMKWLIGWMRMIGMVGFFSVLSSLDFISLFSSLDLEMEWSMS